jgi:DNA-binding transcriptional LysR family regulator
LGHFRAQYPEVTLNLKVFNSKQVEEAVTDGRYELGISLSHARPENLKVEQFGVDELVIVVGKGHRLASETAVDPKDLAQETLLMREPNSGTRLFIESKFSDGGVRLTYGLELNNNQVIKALVEANLGTAILSWRTVEMEVLAGRLSSLKVNGLALERPLTLVSRKGHTLSRPASAFRSVLFSSHLDRKPQSQE